MEQFRCELFNKALEEMDYIQVAEWIVACREFIKKEEFNTYEEYLQVLEEFCLEWEEHYKLNKNFYTSDKYQRALIYINYKKRVKLVVDYGSGAEEFTMNNYNRMSVRFVETAKKQLEKSSSDEYKNIINIFNIKNKSRYKELLHNVISQQLFKQIEVRMRVFKNGKLINEKTYEDFIKLCGDEKNYIIVPEKRKKVRNYNEALKDFEISKTLYNEFRKKELCEKEFDKKMFVNLAFALALNYKNAERLLKYNGYTLNSVERQFDEVCSKAFAIGFSREMAIDLIDKRNEELKKKKKYKLIPTITKNRR